MYITPPDPKTREVDDFDFTFKDGMSVPITLDRDSGDSMEYPTPETIVVHLASRTSVDGQTVIPSEDLTFYTKNLNVIRHRKRQITELTPNERAEWTKVFQEYSSKTVQ